MNQTTFLGASATINCNYTRVKESGIKSFCREDASSYCNNLISSYDSNYTRLDRFSLRDDKQQRVYTVIISALTQQDAGKYQCSIKSGTSTSCLTEIHLYILSEYWSDFWFNVIIILVNKNTFIYVIYIIAIYKLQFVKKIAALTCISFFKTGTILNHMK